MTAVRGIVLGAMAVVALAACAKKVEPPPAPTVATTTTEGDGKIQQTSVVTVTATVQAIDYKTRLVTLLGPEGDTLTITASPEVRNLDQVKRGDLVVVGYEESIALQLKKPGEAEPEVKTAEVTERAAVGAKPGAGAADSVSVTTKIIKIDKKNQRVTLKGPEGNTAVVTVKDPSRLDKVKVGDLVEITYTQALAISVEKAPKK
jgi:Cu/Ag efflux protein CusF